ncbi:hypothetical protein [Arthrobacter sp. M4]|uniref:hypothetical protein n=1 Tax=Arthrobacter sp. M4 TaxID=218160 RepID=UPI001CDD416E|nr:hypothetical protein [Arthrobacter sp. M4]MCA4134752.1 hypothetical protein [Arthrobacter sp. M4]
MDASITKNQIELSSGSMRPSLAVATTKHSISISWRRVNKENSYQVFRDGRLVADELKDAFSEGNLKPNTNYEYQIIESGNQPSAERLHQRTFRVTTSSETRPTLLAYQPYTNAVEYKTFIPDNRVSLDLAGAFSCDVVGQSGWEFGGDNLNWGNPDSLD